MNTLKSQRICTISDDGLYMIIDYYYQVDGQPMTCIIQVNKDIHQASQHGRISLPNYLHIHREITDEDNYAQRNMAKKDYEMPDEDKNKTAVGQIQNNNSAKDETSNQSSNKDEAQ